MRKIALMLLPTKKRKRKKGTLCVEGLISAITWSLGGRIASILVAVLRTKSNVLKIKTVLSLLPLHSKGTQNQIAHLTYTLRKQK